MYICDKFVINIFVIQIFHNKKYKVINIRLFNLLRTDIYLIIRNIFLLNFITRSK